MYMQPRTFHKEYTSSTLVLNPLNFLGSTIHNDRSAVNLWL
jgi:hypothetical protein